MIDLYHGLSPNVLKVTIFLEEAGLEYRNRSVDLSMGEQLKPEFLALSTNGKVPVIVDHAPADGGADVVVFESGAILVYLAEKTGRFLPAETRARTEVMQWLFWQMAGLGPISGQNAHFRAYANELDPDTDHRYARRRYTQETNRLYGVLNHRLRDREFVAGDYSIADMVSYPWVRLGERLGQKREDFPHLGRWTDVVGSRPAVQRAYERNTREQVDWSASREVLLQNFFNQTAATLYPPRKSSEPIEKP